MIYNNSYLKKELRHAYIENKISTKRQLMFGVFVGLLSIAIHLVLQTLVKSVLNDTMPHIMQASYFSTIYTYITTAFFVLVIYYTVYYDYLSFSEIRKNRWYLLVKMGYRPVHMIFSKLIALFFSLLTTYSLGFLVAVVMTAFLKYNFVNKYLSGLYFVGLMDLIVIGSGITTASLYIKQKANARYVTLLCLAGIIVLRYVTGYQKIVSNRITMQNFFVLFQFNRSLYLPISALIVLSCMAICFFKAKSIAKYYSIPYDTYGYSLPENTEILRHSRSGSLIPLNNTDASKRRSQFFDAVSISLLIIIICVTMLFNIFLILLSTSQPGREVTLFGTIPYVFASITMQPEIHENDLTFFKRVSENESVSVGDIVLFQDKNVVYVERVTEVTEEGITVDIDYYPPMSQVGSMIKTIDRSSIYGIYTGHNRWLGALILFANTIFGRLTFLLVPVLLLFFYKPIKEFFTRETFVSDDE